MTEGLVLSKGAGEASIRCLTRDYWNIRVDARARAGSFVKVRMDRFVPPTGGRVEGWYDGAIENATCEVGV